MMAELGAIFLRPDRKGEPSRFGGLGGIRQCVESIIDTIEGQLSLERHGAHTMPRLITRIAQRLLALAAGLWHNWNIHDPGRRLTAYDHDRRRGTESVIWRTGEPGGGARPGGARAA
jgi:hypothetical protein